MLYHTSLYLRKISIPLNSFHDLNKFVDIRNNESGSGNSMFGGNVKRKDLVEYRRWLKDNFYGAANDAIGSRTIAPEENHSLDNCSWDNFPLDDCPPDNCPPDNCP